MYHVSIGVYMEKLLNRLTISKILSLNWNLGHTNLFGIVTIDHLKRCIERNFSRLTGHAILVSVNKNMWKN